MAGLSEGQEFGQTHIDGQECEFSDVLVGYGCCLSQLSGSRLGRSDRRVDVMLLTTSLSHTQGVAPQRLADSIREYTVAAQCTPASLPAKSQFLRPTTTFLNARSLVLFSTLTQAHSDSCR